MSDEAKVREALSHISPEDRETWWRMGMAVKSELGEAGFDVWDEWSQQAESHSTSAAKSAWRSFHDGKITAGSLYYEAKQSGWNPSGRHQFRKITHEELAERERRIREAEKQRQQDATRAKEWGRKIWRAADPLPLEHPYMVSRDVAPTKTLAQVDAATAERILGYRPKRGDDSLTGLLVVVPLKRGNDFVGVELIDGEGRKSVPAGTDVKGAYWSPEQLPEADPQRILIAEGVATALSARAACGIPCVAARTAGNLPPVAAGLRERFPNAGLVILGETGGGLRFAEQAARAVGGKLCIFEGDANDEYRRNGPEAVNKAIEAAQPPPQLPEPQESGASGSSALLSDPVVRVVRGDEVSIVPVRWYWDGYLPAGKVVLIGGAPGTGKTTIAIDLAATITKGGSWPDRGRTDAGDILIWSGEDSVSDTLAARFKAAGADMSRVHFVLGVDTAEGGRPFDPAQDFPRLIDVARSVPDLRLIIVDPIVMAVAGDSHKNAETRRGLQPLVDLAEQCGAVVLGVTHFSKGTQGRDPIERITGSLAFAAVARLVLVAAKVDESNGGGRILVRSKNNLGPDGGGFKYELEQAEIDPGVMASRIKWGEAIDGNAREILASAEVVAEPDEAAEVRGASEWLQDQLGPGELVKSEVMRRAREAGFAERTVQRARQRIGALAVLDGFGANKRSVWKHPPPPIHANEASIVPIVPTNLLGTHGTNGGTNEDEVVF